MVYGVTATIPSSVQHINTTFRYVYCRSSCSIPAETDVERLPEVIKSNSFSLMLMCREGVQYSTYIINRYKSYSLLFIYVIKLLHQIGRHKALFTM